MGRLRRDSFSVRSSNPLPAKGKRGARGIRTLVAGYPANRISRSRERGAEPGTGGHRVFRIPSVRASRGRRRHPRWDSVGTRFGSAWTVQSARGTHTHTGGNPKQSRPGDRTLVCASILSFHRTSCTLARWLPEARDRGRRALGDETGPNLGCDSRPCRRPSLAPPDRRPPRTKVGVGIARSIACNAGFGIRLATGSATRCRSPIRVIR
jgi:hypothetical protein